MFTAFVDYVPDFSCWRAAHWFYDSALAQIDDSECFQVEGLSFQQGWLSYGDEGILMNREAAKLILDESLHQSFFVEGLIEGDVSYLKEEGFYTNTNLPPKQRNDKSHHRNAICFIPDNTDSQRIALNEKG